MSTAEQTIKFYDEHASSLAEAYDILDPSELYPELEQLLPEVPARILDIGGGTGRDARWLRSMGHVVTVAEPSRGMQQVAAQNGITEEVTWVRTSLPSLEGVKAPAGGFDFILVAAVWMHLTREERDLSWKRIHGLLANRAAVLITLRHGAGDDRRPMHKIIPSEEIVTAMAFEFSSASVIRDGKKDKLGRSDVAWDLLLARK